MNYLFILKNDKTNRYRLISQLLVFLNLLAFVFFLITDESAIKNNLWILLAVIATSAYSFFALIERIIKKPMPDFWHRSVLAYCAVAWIKTGLWWITILTLLFIALDYLALKKQIVKVSADNLTVPSFLVKKVDWSELNNVILKDGLLTIDFKNNKLFQQTLLTSDWDVNEKEFNEFCQQQLNK
jgi:hypothetical protein